MELRTAPQRSHQEGLSAPITNGPPVPERLSDRYVPATLASKRASGLACATQRARSRVEAHPGEASTNIHEGPLMRFGAHIDLMSRSKLKCAHFLPSRLSVQVHSGTLGAHRARHLRDEGGRDVHHHGSSGDATGTPARPFLSLWALLVHAACIARDLCDSAPMASRH